MRVMNEFVRLWTRLTCVTALACALGACGSSGGTIDKLGQAEGIAIPARRGTVIVDGCQLDAWQQSTLSDPRTRRVVAEVVLLCAVPRFDGGIGPSDPSARAGITRAVASLRGQGYRAKLGVAFTDETGARYDGQQTLRLLLDGEWRSRAVTGLAEMGLLADGLELDLQNLPSEARPTLTTFVRELSTAVRPARELSMWIAPSVTLPSDLPGGDAFDVTALAELTDRMHVGTLDFSCCGVPPGPTLDSGWAVDAVRLARTLAPRIPLDVAVPLYGTDFSQLGQRTTSWYEARALAERHRARIDRGATGSPHFGYTDDSGRPHDLWFDDTESTTRVLRAWDTTTLPLDVGVVFYGLGAEDPTLFPTVAASTP
ncbi:MAG: peptidoglycan hydrolase [Myxococcaceae bacterium]|nr:peptidoglycan hydrolase [Myxococcaceae bacterium]